MTLQMKIINLTKFYNIDFLKLNSYYYIGFGGLKRYECNFVFCIIFRFEICLLLRWKMYKISDIKIIRLNDNMDKHIVFNLEIFDKLTGMSML